MLTDKKLTAYSKIVAGLPDVPSPAMSALQLKQHFDTAPEEMRVAFNALIDNLLSTTTGDSGAESIGIEPIAGVNAANVQNALEQLKLLMNDAVSGAIPDGTLGPEKLTFDPATQAELDAHLADTVTHVSYALATGTANTYAVTLTPAPTSYARGMAVSVEINVLNTGASTININGLGAKTIKKSNGNDVSAGGLKVGIIYTLRYNGTNFILQGEGGEYGTAGAAQALTGYSVGTENGLVAGLIPDLGATNISSSFTADVAIPAGYRNGVGVVKRPVPSVGDVEIAKVSNLPGRTGAYIKAATATINVTGSYRVAFAINQSGSGTVSGRIYKNGVAVGIERSTSSTSPVTFTEDFSVVAGDTLELWVKAASGTVVPSLFSLSINIPIYAAIT